MERLLCYMPTLTPISSEVAGVTGHGVTPLTRTQFFANFWLLSELVEFPRSSRSNCLIIKAAVEILISSVCLDGKKKQPTVTDKRKSSVELLIHSQGGLNQKSYVCTSKRMA